MNILKLSTLAFAALMSVSVQAQTITTYGEETYPGYGHGGNWDGSTGQAIKQSTTPWAAQTFIAPTSGPTTIYAYNVQLNNSSTGPASFTTSIYQWTGSTLGALVADTSSSFTREAGLGFDPYGANVVTNPGIGTVALTPGAYYALVVHRTDSGTTGVVQVGMDTSGTFSNGIGYTSTNGTTYNPMIGGFADLAFWISFSADSLSPVPEPAVNGAIIGAVFVAGLVAWRRYGKKRASEPLLPAV